MGVAAAAFAVVLLKSGFDRRASAAPAPDSDSSQRAAAGEPSLTLAASQLSAIKVEPVGTFPFPIEKEAIGNIDFDGDRSVQVFPSYQGKILRAFVELGGNVEKGQALYAIDSPDLVNAESTLIGAEATLELTSKELTRAKRLFGTSVGVSERELEQAINDQQAADGAYKAARDAMRVFGKTSAEIDEIVSQREIDPALVVRSPIAGQITAMNAPPGYLVQPGTPPAPYSVADVNTKWMFGNVPESDSPDFHAGQPVKASVMAYPGRAFTGTVSKVYETVDPNLHTMLIRSEILDPENELRPGMLVNIVVRVQDPVISTALPSNGVVRESDGKFTAWVTTDRHLFMQRVVKIGLRYGGMVQVLEGLRPGELAVTDGAVFLSNLLDMPPSD